MNDYSEQIERLKQALSDADAVVIGAGAGLSTAAGFSYGGERFKKHFSDFEEKYGIRDMYSGGFYPFPTLEEFWAFWSRSVLINRYISAPKPVYDDLLKLVSDKDYFVITTCAALSALRKADGDESALRRHVRAGRGLAQSRRAVRKLSAHPCRAENSVFRAGRGIQHPGYHKVSVLADDGAERKRGVCLHKYGADRLPGGYKTAVDMH